jgi:hypothetical protein
MKKWELWEEKFLKSYYPLYGLTFCSMTLERNKKSINEKRIKLNLKYADDDLKINNNFIYDKNNLKVIVKQSNTFSECCDKLNIHKTGASYSIIKKYCNIYNVDYTHFTYKHKIHTKISLNDILIENSTYSSTSNLKNRLYKEGIKERKCELCGQNERWKDKHMSLILDHINGNNKDNRLENLRIVCPNCNATLETHCKGYKRLKKENDDKICSCGNPKSKESKCCLDCHNKTISFKQRKVTRPPYEQLLDEIKNSSYVQVGKKYNVSDNAIRKWVKYYEKQNI